jgi:hypothetical protein
MIRYKFELAHDNKVLSCRDCLENCRQKYHGGTACMNGKFVYRNPEISSLNAYWMLKQILYDIQVSKCSAETIINEHRMNWIRPDSLNDIGINHYPTATESMMFRDIMGVFIHFLLKRMDEKDKIKHSEVAVALVNSIINTKIKVEKKTVYIYTRNSDLFDNIKKIVKEQGYKFDLLSELTDKEFFKTPS